MLPVHKFHHPTPWFWLRRPLLQSFLVVAAAVTLLSFAGLSRTHTYTLTWADADASSQSQSPPSESSPDLRQEYVVFSSHSLPPPQPRIQTLPEWCIDGHFTLGHTCAPHYYGNALQKGASGDKFDLVWTWVNSTDVQLRAAMDDARREEGLELEEIDVESTEPTEDKLYRDHDELRHSFRSVLRHFRTHANSFTLFTSDFPFPVEADTQSLFDAYEEEQDGYEVEDEYVEKRDAESEKEALRVGLRPSWLTPDMQGWMDQDVELGLQFQSEVWGGYAGTSFNSYSIESQLHRLQFPSDNDIFLYLNDDFFMMSDLVPADFHTSAMGAVLRLDPTLLVASEPPPETVEAISALGEWGPLYASNALLSDRFCWRARPYTQHVPKALSRSSLQEVSEMWPAAMARTAGHKFRGMVSENGREGDAYGVFLAMHLGVERWREALLWSFVVARIGGDGDEWGEPERARAWAAVDGDEREAELRVRLTSRKSADEGRVKAVMRKAGYARSDRTRYAFSSEDGYPYTFPGALETDNGWPVFSGKDLGRDLCVLPRACFSGTSAGEIFKRVAFEEAVACGDCMIHALRAQSGEYGLSAFLPAPQRTIIVDARNINKSTQAETVIPRLPLQGEGDFQLQSILADRTRGGAVHLSINVRQWTLRLLERYRFVLGDSGDAFLMIRKPQDANDLLFSWMDSDWGISLACVNDDIAEQHEETDALIREWEDKRWGTKAAWER